MEFGRRATTSITTDDKSLIKLKWLASQYWYESKHLWAVHKIKKLCLWASWLLFQAVSRLPVNLRKVRPLFIQSTRKKQSKPQKNETGTNPVPVNFGRLVKSYQLSAFNQKLLHHDGYTSRTASSPNEKSLFVLEALYEQFSKLFLNWRVAY